MNHREEFYQDDVLLALLLYSKMTGRYPNELTASESEGILSDTQGQNFKMDQIDKQETRVFNPSLRPRGQPHRLQ